MVRITVILIFVVAGCGKAIKIEKKDVQSGTVSLLQAISFADQKNVWVSGHLSTVGTSSDGGMSWTFYKYPKGDSVQFRDIHAIDQDQVVLMSAGPGDKSGIYLFTPPNRWVQTYSMPHPQGFLNTIEFWNDTVGLAFGDSFFNQHFLLKTTDGGQTWNRIDPTRLPIAGEGEGGFAASGSCISLLPDGRAWIGTGAGGHSHVLYSDDFGESWSSDDAPLIKGEAAGITSIHIMDNGFGMVVGGDLAITDAFTDNIAITEDFGQTWQKRGFPVTLGAFYGSAIFQFDNNVVLFISGPNGVDFSLDGGSDWENLSKDTYWAIAVHPSGSGIACGKDGKILKLNIH